MSVATGSTTPRDFGGYRRIHLFERLRSPVVCKHSCHIFGPREDRRRLQQYLLGSIPDQEAGARLPTPALRRGPG